MWGGSYGVTALPLWFQSDRKFTLFGFPPLSPTTLLPLRSRRPFLVFRSNLLDLKILFEVMFFLAGFVILVLAFSDSSNHFRQVIP